MFTNLLIYLTKPGEGPVSELKDLIIPEVKSAFIIVLIVGAVVLAWTRKMTLLLSFGALMLLTGFFVFAPELVGKLGEAMGKTLFENWSK